LNKRIASYPRLLLLGLVLVGLVTNSIRNTRYETMMMVSVDYPPLKAPTPPSLQFGDAFWAEVSKAPDVKRLLEIEKPLDAKAWLMSRCTVQPLKNSPEIMTLKMHRNARGDVGPLEEYQYALKAISEEMRKQAEADGADFQLMQDAALPLKVRGPMFR